jgi:hypothetical protein
MIGRCATPTSRGLLGGGRRRPRALLEDHAGLFPADSRQRRKQTRRGLCDRRRSADGGYLSAYRRPGSILEGSDRERPRHRSRASRRLSRWGLSTRPRDMTTERGAFLNYPNLVCIARDGSRLPWMSYAHPEVRPCHLDTAEIAAYPTMAQPCTMSPTAGGEYEPPLLVQGSRPAWKKIRQLMARPDWLALSGYDAYAIMRCNAPGPQ